MLGKQPEFTRKQEAQGLQLRLRTKQRIEALHEQDRERKRRALLEEQRVVQSEGIVPSL